MKTICVLAAVIAFVVVVVQADSTLNWAGTTKGSASWTPPQWSSDNVCTPQSSQTPFVNFTVTFDTDGVREVAAMAENSFKSSLSLYIYTGTSFNPTTPCANAINLEIIDEFDNSGGPVLDSFVFFAAGTYTFVATGGSGGIFAVNIFPSNQVGQLDIVSTWYIPTLSGGQCSSGYTAVPFSSYTWTQATSGNFDILALFANSSQSDWYSYLAFYSGAVNTSALIVDPCNNAFTNASLLNTSSSDSFGVYLPYIPLTAGWVYTIVFSGYYPTNYAYWGVQIIPTRIHFQQSPTWTQPERGEAPNCEASEDNAASWDSIYFLSTERAYLLDTATPPNYYFPYIDTYTFLYQGDNRGVPGVYGPSTCPLFGSLVIGGDTGDVTPVYALTQPNVNYTVVVSTYSGYDYSTGGGAYLVYLFTGAPIGSLPPSTTATTGAATTGAATTGAATTGAATTGAATTGAATTTKSTTGAATTGAATTGTATTGTATTTKSTTAATGTTAAATTAAATTGGPVSTTSSASRILFNPVACLFGVVVVLKLMGL